MLLDSLLQNFPVNECVFKNIMACYSLFSYCTDFFHPMLYNIVVFESSVLENYVKTPHTPSFSLSESDLPFSFFIELDFIVRSSPCFDELPQLYLC